MPSMPDKKIAKPRSSIHLQWHGKFITEIHTELHLNCLMRLRFFISFWVNLWGSYVKQCTEAKNSRTENVKIVLR
jgi:hypothetical protein